MTCSRKSVPQCAIHVLFVYHTRISCFFFYKKCLLCQPIRKTVLRTEKSKKSMVKICKLKLCIFDSQSQLTYELCICCTPNYTMLITVLYLSFFFWQSHGPADCLNYCATHHFAGETMSKNNYRQMLLIGFNPKTSSLQR